MSPCRPFLSPQPHVCSRNQRLVPSHAPRNANISPVLSHVAHTSRRHGGVGSANRSPLVTRHCSFVFITLQIPFPATPLFSHPYKTPGVSPLRHSPFMPSPPLCPLCLCGKPHVLSSLPPLCRSWRSFSHSLPLFSIACRLFLQNTGGWGIPILSTFRCAFCIPNVFTGPSDAASTRGGMAFAFARHSPPSSLLPPRHASDTEATVGSRGGKGAFGGKCAIGLSY